MFGDTASVNADARSWWVVPSKSEWSGNITFLSLVSVLKVEAETVSFLSTNVKFITLVANV